MTGGGVVTRKTLARLNRALFALQFPPTASASSRQLIQIMRLPKSSSVGQVRNTRSWIAGTSSELT